jgi:hypothetical protein
VRGIGDFGTASFEEFLLERTWRGWEDNIRMDLSETDCGNGRRTYLLRIFGFEFVVLIFRSVLLGG